MTSPERLNALHLPWVPVTLADGTDTRLGLADLFRQAHEIRGLGRRLTPIERESLHRFLPSVAAVILQGADENLLDEVSEAGRFPAHLVDAFVETHGDAFALNQSSRPFLQRHDLKQSDVEALVTAKKPLVGEDPGTSIARPPGLLHPHVPGASSSQWAVRRDDRDPATDLGVLTLLLVVTWWQTRRGNGRGLDGRTLENGNPGQAGVRPLSVHWIGPHLGLTLAAGVPEAWLDSPELPMWLDRDAVPADLAHRPHGLWRSTYARNIPLLLWSDDIDPVPLGFVLGPATAPVPVLAADAKASLVAMHEEDHARLFQTATKKNKSAERKQVTAGDSRLISTEGYVRWYANHLGAALKDWAGQRRMANPDDRWQVAVYSEVCHTTGSREASDWVVLPMQRLAPAGVAETRIATAIQAIQTLRAKMFAPMTVACEGRRYKDARPVALPAAQAQFYALVETPLVEFIATAQTATDADVRATAEEFRNLALTAFTAATQPLLTPATLPQVSTARRFYADQTRRHLAEIFASSTTLPATSKEAADA